MKRKQLGPDLQAAHAARFAWWVAFLTTVALVVGLGVVRSANAAELPAPSFVPAAITAEAEDFGDDEGEEDDGEEMTAAEECELAEEEGELAEEEGEECESKDEREAKEAGCLLRSASASAVALPARHQLLLTVHYSAFSEANVSVVSQLRGGRGQVHLRPERRHLARSGVLHLDQHLTPSQMERAAVAHSFEVELRADGEPPECHLLDRGTPAHRPARRS